MKKYTNNKGISLPLAVWLARDEYNHDPRPNVVSVTGLLKSTRSIILASRVPKGEGIPDVSMLLAARMGTALHNAIESAWVNNYANSLAALGYPKKVIERIRINPTEVKKGDIPIYLEKRSERQLGKWIISGQFDMVCDGFVMDVKSTGCSAYTQRYKDEDYILQGSIYRWLNQDIINRDQIKMQMIFKDWSLIASYSQKNYPPMPVHEYSLNLKPMHEIEAFISKKLADIEKYWDADEKDIPLCTNKELWVRDTTWKYYAKVDSKKASKVFRGDAAKQEAYVHLQGKGKGFVKEHKSAPNACLYCPAAPECSQAKKYIREGILKVG